MRKYIMIALGLGLILGGFWLSNFMKDQKDTSKPKEIKTKQTVFVKPVQNRTIATKVIESGSLVAKRRVEIYSEVQGIMEPLRKEFKAGVDYSQGETMVKIRSHDFYANLQAQKSNFQNLVTSILPDLRLDFPDAYPKWDAYVRSFDLSTPIAELPKPTSDKEKFFITGKNIYSSYYNTKNMELVLSKYTLRAPFSGTVSESLVNPGTLIRQGQKLGEFIDPSMFELEIAVSKTLLSYIKLGKKVDVSDIESKQSWVGKIIRINEKVDPSSQTVQVFIALQGKGLKEGLFLEAEMVGKEEKDAIEVNRSLLIDGEAIFVVEDDQLNLIPVDVVFYSKETAIIKGLKDGQRVITKPVSGGYSGMEVTTSVLKENP